MGAASQGTVRFDPGGPGGAVIAQGRAGWAAASRSRSDELAAEALRHLALREPSRARALVTLNAIHPFWSLRRLAPHAWRSWWTPPVEMPLVGRTVLRRAPAFLRLLFRLGRHPRDAAPFLAALREPARAAAAQRMQREFAFREIVPTLLGRHRDTRLRVPTLMLNETRDFALAAGELGGHEAHADDLRVQLVRGGGHFLHEERPELVTEAVLAASL